MRKSREHDLAVVLKSQCIGLVTAIVAVEVGGHYPVAPAEGRVDVPVGGVANEREVLPASGGDDPGPDQQLPVAEPDNACDLIRAAVPVGPHDSPLTEPGVEREEPKGR
jgi:hypothetical protein